MSVNEYEQRVNDALSKLPFEQLAQAVQYLEDAIQILGQPGSQQPEITQSAGALQEAGQQLTSIHNVIQQAQSLLTAYLASIGKAPAAVPVTASNQTRPANPPEPGRLSQQQVDKIRQELPDPVPKPNPENRKTHGQWIDSAGNVHKTVSGQDDRSAAAWRRLQEAGVPSDRQPVITTHVEAKVAAEMIETGQRHTSLVINNRPCVGPLGCDSLLPVMLPKGYSVTVYGPDGYTQTFQGGEEW